MDMGPRVSSVYSELSSLSCSSPAVSDRLNPGLIGRALGPLREAIVDKLQQVCPHASYRTGLHRTFINHTAMSRIVTGGFYGRTRFSP